VSDVLEFAVLGLPIGCVFALMAMGLVLTYKTSGVFHLAYAAQAYAAARIFYELRVQEEWPLLPAAVLVILVISPLIGLLLERALFRHLRTADPTASLIVSLGLLVAIPQIVIVLLGDEPTPTPSGLWPDGAEHVFNLGVTNLDGDQIAAILAAVLSLIGLTVMFRYSSLGLSMRAVVESPRMAELNGINADRVSAVAWAISSVFAGLAGVLLGTLFPAGLQIINFFTLLVAALAAAAFGRLQSVPLTFLGAVLLGVIQQLLSRFMPEGIVRENILPSLPFLALFLLLLFWPGLRQTRLSDPLAGVDPPPPRPAALDRPRALTISTRVLAVVVIGVGIPYAMFGLRATFLNYVLLGVAYATIFLSITVMTGMGGLVSLSQAAFAAVGAYTVAQLAEQQNMPVLLGMLIGAGLAALLGALIALPVMRLEGIYLSLATIAFALMFDKVIIPQEWVGGQSVPIQVPRPVIGTFEFEEDRWFLLLAVAVLALAATATFLVKRGTTGKFLDAMRGSQVAANSVGINHRRARITAFALSAGLAGLGGGLLAMIENPQANRYAFTLGLFWAVIVITLGARSVQAAIISGFSFVLVEQFLRRLDIGWLPDNFNPAENPLALATILFGLGAITYSRHPEGVMEAQTRASIARTSRWFGLEPTTDTPADDVATEIRLPDTAEPEDRERRSEPESVGDG
jgi:branched-subunit amino acid ABC-type transport system permease component